MVIDVGVPPLALCLALVLWERPKSRGPGSVQAGLLPHCSLATPCLVRGASPLPPTHTQHAQPLDLCWASGESRLSLSAVIPSSPSFWRSATSEALHRSISNQIHKQNAPSWAPSQGPHLPSLHPLLRQPLLVTQASLIPPEKQRPIQVLPSWRPTPVAGFPFFKAVHCNYLVSLGRTSGTESIEPVYAPGRREK